MSQPNTTCFFFFWILVNVKGLLPSLNKDTLNIYEESDFSWKYGALLLLSCLPAVPLAFSSSLCPSLCLLLLRRRECNGSLWFKAPWLGHSCWRAGLLLKSCAYYLLRFCLCPCCPYSGEEQGSEVENVRSDSVWINHLSCPHSIPAVFCIGTSYLHFKT